MAQEIRNSWGAGWALGALANISRDEGNLKKEIHYLEESVLIYRELGDQQETAVPLLRLGWIKLTQGDYDRATEFLKESFGVNPIFETTS